MYFYWPVLWGGDEERRQLAQDDHAGVDEDAAQDRHSYQTGWGSAGVQFLTGASPPHHDGQHRHHKNVTDQELQVRHARLHLDTHQQVTCFNESSSSNTKKKSKYKKYIYIYIYFTKSLSIYLLSNIFRFPYYLIKSGLDRDMSKWQQRKTATLKVRVRELHCYSPCRGWGRSTAEWGCRGPCIWRDWRRWPGNIGPLCTDERGKCVIVSCATQTP